jgi:hypothetical protein
MCGKPAPVKAPSAAAFLINVRLEIPIVPAPGLKTKKALPMRAYASIGRALLPVVSKAALSPPIPAIGD